MTFRTIQTMKTPVLFDLQAISVRFGQLEALKSVDLQILQGQRVALIGSNGSGKSTLLRVLNGLISPKSSQKSGRKTGFVSGTIQTDANLRQAMLFQRPHLLRMSVQANVAMGLWLAGTGWAEAKTWALKALAICQDAVARTAAACRFGAGLGCVIGYKTVECALTRRANSQYGSARQARGRSADARLCCTKHDAGIFKPQLRPSQTAGDACGVFGAWQAAGLPAGG
jgi:ABC-type uncharacterized transport system YnjBCD ATPase subunit